MGIGKDTFIVSVFAPIGYQKGHDFLLEVIPKLPDVLFLCVGSVTDYNLLEQLEKHPNFKHLPQQKDMNELYAITDIVMRCEDYFPLGRTVFEGIYAGCFVLLPYRKGDLLSEEITPQMYLYVARGIESCTYAIDTLVSLYPKGTTDNGFEPTSNVKDVSEKLIEKIMHE
jgi:glycosyltransferase involved in cell wall biosynthesis